MRYAGFYEVVKHLSDSLRQAGCLVVTFGDAESYDQDKITVTPGAHITPVGLAPSNSRIAVGMTQLTFDVVVYGMNSHHKLSEAQGAGSDEGFTAMLDVLDTTMAIIDKFAAIITNTTNEDDYSINGTVAGWSYAENIGNSQLIGWQGQVTINIHGGKSRC
jgi:hypothetical protein